ncbi:2-dehydropantoate 2-reductase [Nonomuraea terrae]|uniref:2-dehydropantoate 2-reductase n=1 Tax=Nonomuraea terrae TaxID=2530383 RepID=A0A4R4YLJ6_9ACTN|nr:2-dehydropantoate 2-reductase [Nonomuraea terrae]TDD45861.1 2-dehydropantoate 2-reductase [Nonomuraea terrae]
MARPEIAVIGAGAIGVVVAAAAAENGGHVQLCVRTRPEQVVVERDGELHRPPLDVVGEPGTAGTADWVLVATKAQDTPGAVAWLRALTGPDTVVVVLQNGVDQRERLAPLLPPDTPVLPALVYVNAESIARGHVLHREKNLVELPPDPDAERFAALLAGSALSVRTVPDFTTAAWRKLLINVGANPVTALTLRRIGVLREPEVRALVEGLLTETAAVGAAAGAALSGEDVAWAMAFYDSLSPDAGTSMLYDRVAGRTTEHEVITGAVVRLGSAHGVPTPLNQTLLTLLRALEINASATRAS